ncbi:MAG: MotA/TolQ/ExbB proton channel family protein [Pirellulaceae bacterium]
MINTETFFFILGVIMYVVLGLIALWGAFCVVTVWRRVAQKRFRNEKAMSAFLDEVEAPLSKGDFNTALEICDGDQRAMPQLIFLALENRKIGFTKVRQLVLDRFERDVLSDLEHRLSWVNTVIKSAPMVGLLGTVIGMMGAFQKIGGGQGPQAEKLATDIMTALITTACGLAIAIPLVLCTASINVRIRKMEDLVSYGLSRFLEAFRQATKK